MMAWSSEPSLSHQEEHLVRSSLPARFRCRIVGWMLQLSKSLELQPATLFASTSLLDRFVAMVEVRLAAEGHTVGNGRRNIAVPTLTEHELANKAFLTPKPSATNDGLAGKMNNRKFKEILRRGGCRHGDELYDVNIPTQLNTFGKCRNMVSELKKKCPYVASGHLVTPGLALSFTSFRLALLYFDVSWCAPLCLVTL